MSEMRGELKAFESWWKTTPYKGKKRSVRTIYEYLRVLNHYDETHKDGEYTLASCREWVASEMDRAPSAGRWAARSLKAFDKWQAGEYDEAEVLAKLEVPPDPTPTRTTTAQPDDVAKMLATCGTDFVGVRDAAIIHCFRSTGMRVGELSRMRMEDIDFSTGVVTIPKTKNGEVRKTRLNTEAMRALRKYRRWLSLDKHPHVWESALGGQLRPHSIQKRITARALEGGVPHVTCHSFRRGFAMEFFRKGGSQTYLMTLCGWNSNEMPGRYLKAVAQDESIAMHERLFG